MRVYLLILVVILVATNVVATNAAAELSQQDVGKVCGEFAMEGEIRVVVEPPMSCNGVGYWICEYQVSGITQPVLIAVDKDTGKVPPLSIASDIIGEIVTAKVFHDVGQETIFRSPFFDASYLNKFMGYNTTLENYAQTINNLRARDLMNDDDAEALLSDVAKLKSDFGNSSRKLILMLKIKNSFFEKWECDDYDNLMWGFDFTLKDLGNFSEDLINFTAEYNRIAREINSNEGVFVKLLSPSNPRNLDLEVQRGRAYLKSLRENLFRKKELYMGNIQSRMDMRNTASKIKILRKKIEKSKNPKAQQKYNDALEAFSKGDYTTANRLIKEANEELMSSVADRPTGQNTQYQDQSGVSGNLWQILGILAGILVAVVIGKAVLKGGKEPEEGEGSHRETDDAEEPEPKRSPEGKGLMALDK